VIAEVDESHSDAFDPIMSKACIAPAEIEVFIVEKAGSNFGQSGKLRD